MQYPPSVKSYAFFYQGGYFYSGTSTTAADVKHHCSQISQNIVQVAVAYFYN